MKRRYSSEQISTGSRGKCNKLTEIYSKNAMIKNTEIVYYTNLLYVCTRTVQ